MKLTVNKVMNNLVIRQDEVGAFFIGTKEAIVISVPTLTFILNFMVKTGSLSPKVLEGILSDYYTMKGE